jgi:hypothetical protein
MGYVYICMKRTDIPNGVLQVLDLQPNVSQRNGSIDPPGQTKYVNRLQNDTLVLSGNDTAAQYEGFAAYLIDHVVKNGANVPITAAVANLIAGDLVAVVNAGTALSLAVINASIQARTVDGTSGLTAGGSNGTVADILKIAAGAEYVLPAGTTVITGLNAPVNAGAFTNGQYRNTYDTGAFQISFGEGMIAGFMGASFEYDGTTGAALVCYANDGTLYTL